jgi:hypothetical protein
MFIAYSINVNTNSNKNLKNLRGSNPPPKTNCSDNKTDVLKATWWNVPHFPNKYGNAHEHVAAQVETLARVHVIQDEFLFYYSWLLLLFC